jgi:hypothetical protein
VNMHIGCLFGAFQCRSCLESKMSSSDASIHAAVLMKVIGTTGRSTVKAKQCKRVR